MLGVASRTHVPSLALVHDGGVANGEDVWTKVEQVYLQSTFDLVCSNLCCFFFL